MTDKQLAAALLEHEWPEEIGHRAAFLIGQAAARLMK